MDRMVDHILAEIPAIPLVVGVIMARTLKKSKTMVLHNTVFKWTVFREPTHFSNAWKKSLFSFIQLILHWSLEIKSNELATLYTGINLDRWRIYSKQMKRPLSIFFTDTFMNLTNVDEPIYQFYYWILSLWDLDWNFSYT